MALEVERDPHPLAVAGDRYLGRLGGRAPLRRDRLVEQRVGLAPLRLGARPGRVRLLQAAGQPRLGVAPAARPARPAGAVAVEDLERRLRRLALAVGDVVP